jgi:hypothetical protein
MFAVWNGKKLDFISCENDSTVIFNTARKTLDDAYLEMLPKAYINASRMMSLCNAAGIAVLCDEDGLQKKLPVTLELNGFRLVGSVVFLALSGNEFQSLSESQMKLLSEQFEPLTKHAESEITIKVLNSLIKFMDEECDKKGTTRDAFIEDLISNYRAYVNEQD